MYSDYSVPISILFNEFDFAWVFAAEAVVERGGGGKGGGFVFDDADAAAMTDEDFFKFYGFLFCYFSRCGFGVIGDADGEFTFW